MRSPRERRKKRFFMSCHVGLTAHFNTNTSHMSFSVKIQSHLSASVMSCRRSQRARHIDNSTPKKKKTLRSREKTAYLKDILPHFDVQAISHANDLCTVPLCEKTTPKNTSHQYERRERGALFDPWHSNLCHGSCSKPQHSSSHVLSTETKVKVAQSLLCSTCSHHE